MAGYDVTDPMGDDKLGYRAQAFTSGIVSYNNFVFPPCLRSKVTVVPEYTDDQRTIKWLTIALSIEFIQTDTGVTQIELTDPSEDASVRQSAQDFISDMIKRLSQPCQTLIFSAQGFGEFVVNSSSGSGIKDVDFGPKPQVVEWEPLGGGNAARVEWLCVTRISPCMTGLPSNAVVQFQYSVDWNIDSSGFMTRNVEGTIELPLTRNGSNQESATDLINVPRASNGDWGGLYNSTIRDLIFSSFPMLTRFKRQYFYRIRANKKVIDFKLEDVEIRSESLFPPGVADMEMFANLTTSLDDGLGLVWKYTITGRIECVKAGKPYSIEQSKKIAWLWLAKIIQERRKRVSIAVSVSNKTPGDKKDKQYDGLYDPDASIYLGAIEEDKNYSTGIFPTYISITDSMYGNTILFTVSYHINLTSTLISRAVGLFEPVGQEVGLVQTDWTDYIVKSKAHTERIWPYPDQEFVIDLCHPARVATKVPPKDTVSSYRVESSPIFTPTPPDDGKNWIRYTNVITYFSKSGTVLGRKITEKNIVTTDTLPFSDTTQDKLTTEMANVPFEVGVDYSPSDESDIKQRILTYKPVKDLNYVIMNGTASRYGGRINPPVLLGIGDGIKYDKVTGKTTIDTNQGGALAHRVDDGLARHWSEKTGFKDKDGSDIIIYYCSWNRKYVLDRVPSSGTVVTSGNPRRFD